MVRQDPFFSPQPRPRPETRHSKGAGPDADDVAATEALRALAETAAATTKTKWARPGGEQVDGEESDFDDGDDSDFDVSKANRRSGWDKRKRRGVGKVPELPKGG